MLRSLEKNAARDLRQKYIWIQTSRCPEEFSTERYHRRELAEARKAVKVPGRPAVRKEGDSTTASAWAQMKAAWLWVAPGGSEKRVQRG